MKHCYYLLLLLLIMLFAGTSLRAQDIHFSQFYAHPLALNPTLAGYSEGDYRLAAIYRNQWNTVATPFETYGASFDSRIPLKKVKEDVFGAGISIINDKAGAQGLKLFTGSLSVAYHKQLGKKQKQYLGLGLQLSYTQRSIDYQALRFPSQYDGATINPANPSGENVGQNITMFDMNAGLFYSGRLSERVGIFNGLVVSHLLRPKESFINDDDARLQMKYTIHGGARIRVGKRWHLTPNYIVMLQNKAREINVGSAVEYQLGPVQKGVILSIGGWYRIKDSGIVSAGAEFKRIRLGLSYDIASSSLQQVPKVTSGFEISLIYTGLFAKNTSGPILVPCPRL
ncbi:MAG: PorP/SprF family type IX secretion system membrane protein [Chitinophagales bacterium]|nr:PorP/SprF family type IX secretion system membrane protein [Chitinophagales bacterium]